MSGREKLVSGDLAAVETWAGARWPGLIHEAWTVGAALLPVDARLPELERSALLERARPTALVRDGELVRLDGGLPASAETALVMHTSGTAGRPRLVELGRSAVRSAVSSSSAVLGATAEDPWTCCLPPAHVGGMLVLLRAELLGSPVILHERFDPAALAADPGGFVSLVPTMLARLLDAKVDVSGFRAMLVGGAELRRDLRMRAERAGATVIETYGLTETSGGVVYEGRPFPGTDVRIVRGQILLRGPTQMTGYRHDPSATAIALPGDGWLRSGDAGRIDDEGSLHVLGRLDELITSGGEKVWPQEVEAAVATHPGVAQVAVAGRPDPEWGRRVVAFVVPADPTTPPTLDQLRDHTSTSLARFKAPRELVLLGALPRTASGKVRRAELERLAGRFGK